MKNYTDEDKAKAYDKFVKELKSKFKDFQTIIYDKNDLEKFFPELTESEDERIRKELIQWINEFPDIIWRGHYKKDVIAWLKKQGKIVDYYEDRLDECACKYFNKGYKHALEKQGVQIDIVNKEYWRGYREGKQEILDKYAELEKQSEQKLADKVEPKFKVGDTIQTKQGQMKFVIGRIDDGYYRRKGNNAPMLRISDQNYWELVEQKPTDTIEPKFHEGDWAVSDLDGKTRQISEVHFDEYNSYYVVDGNSVNLEEYDRLHHIWTIEDAKNGDVLFCKGTIKNSNGIKYERICLFNNLDNAFFTLTKTSNYVEEYDIDVNIDYPDNTVPATKEQKEILFMAMADTRYTFDFEKKELKKIEPIFKVGDKNVKVY